MNRLPALLSVLLLVGCAQNTNPYGELNQAFDDAATTWDVPRDLLVAIAWANSRMEQRSTSEYGHTQTQVGIMGLRYSGQPNADVAADLIGVSVDLLAEQADQNILAAAAWLHDEAGDRYELTREKVDTLEEWYPVVAAFSGALDPLVAEGFAYEVFSSLEYGVFAYTEDGEYIEVVPQDLPFISNRTATSGSGLIAQFVPADSSNYSDYSRGPEDIDYIIVHTTQGSYSGCISWFQNATADVSAHYVVRSSDGEITQMVNEEDVGWHAGNWDYNLTSVGIEHEGWVESPDTWYTDAMYSSSAALVADIADRNGIPKDRSHIIGHYEIPGATHTDPGSGWDWDRFMDLVAQGGGGLAWDGSWDGARSGNFEAEIYSVALDVTDTCSGAITGQVANGNVYLTGTCRLDDHGSRSGDIPITWSGSITGNEVDGRLVVDSYTDAWRGEVRMDGTVVGEMSGTKDLGGDLGTIQYHATIDAPM